MTKSDFIEMLGYKLPHMQINVVEKSVKLILEQMSQALEEKQRIEVRGFGSFSLHYRQPRIGRNPKTGENVKLKAKYVPHFKAGKDLKERVDFR